MGDCKYWTGTHLLTALTLNSLDIIYLARETFWQPTEGQIPEALRGAD